MSTPAMRATTACPTCSKGIALRKRKKRRSSGSRSRPSFFLQVSVHQLLDEFDALVFEELSVLFLPAVEGHRDFPGAGKYLWILDRCLVGQVIRTAACITFDHMERVAVEVSGAIEPRLIVEARDIDDERVAFPMPARPSHP